MDKYQSMYHYKSIDAFVMYVVLPAGLWDRSHQLQPLDDWLVLAGGFNLSETCESVGLPPNPNPVLWTIFETLKPPTKWYFGAPHFRNLLDLF